MVIVALLTALSIPILGVIALIMAFRWWQGRWLGRIRGNDGQPIDEPERSAGAFASMALGTCVALLGITALMFFATLDFKAVAIVFGAIGAIVIAWRRVLLFRHARILRARNNRAGG